MLCFGVTALAAALAVLLGRRSLQDATVFSSRRMTGSMLSTPEARYASGAGCGLAAGAAEVQELLRGIADRRSLPSSADELLKVERLRKTEATTS
ncbi:MAG: hypothetical protein ACLUEK_00125 [Oscillospiraceae bacterium]